MEPDYSVEYDKYGHPCWTCRWCQCMFQSQQDVYMHHDRMHRTDEWYEPDPPPPTPPTPEEIVDDLQDLLAEIRG